LIQNGRYRISDHALFRLTERGISKESVIKVILNGEIIEDYPTDKPYPSCLMLGWIGQRPIHVALSMDEENGMVYIITNYEPTLNKSESDYKTRRK
jgi:Domain of unknown function (DUF4258)